MHGQFPVTSTPFVSTATDAYQNRVATATGFQDNGLTLLDNELASKNERNFLRSDDGK